MKYLCIPGLLILYFLLILIESTSASSPAVGLPCVGINPCPTKDGCVNNTATKKQICVCRLAHLDEDGQVPSSGNYSKCTKGYSPWNIGSVEDGKKVASPAFQYERVPDKAFGSSGTYVGYKTFHARLHETLGKGGWCAPSGQGTYVLEINTGSSKSTVRMIATQGLGNSATKFLVSSYKIQYFDDTIMKFKYYVNSSKKAIIYTGNTANDDVVYNFFDPPITAKRIRIEPITFENLKCLRVELYGDKKLDECQHSWGQCDKEAQCNDTLSSYSCTCPKGWTDVNKDGFICKSIDECTETKPGLKHNCHKDAQCTDTRDKFTCACKPGYQGDGFYCEDMDECLDNKHECHRNAICTNTVGSHECACKAGYKGDGKATCDDIDECKLGQDNCHSDADCVNTQGSFECYCQKGYEDPAKTNGRSCVDINECARGNPCHAQALCTNEVGRYICTCKDGYRGSGKFCKDIDECAEGSAYCKPTERCYNIQGTFECMCPKHIPLQQRYYNQTEVNILDKLLKNVRDVSVQDWQYSLQYHAHVIRSIFSLMKHTYNYHVDEVRNSFYVSFVKNNDFGVEMYDFRCTEVVNLNFPNLCHKSYEKTVFMEYTDNVEMHLTDTPTKVFESWATTGPPTPPVPGATTPNYTADVITPRPLTTKIVNVNGTNITFTEKPRTTPKPFTKCGEYINKPPPNDEFFALESPIVDNFDERYPSNARCIWTIQAPPDHDVYIQFTDFDLEYDPKCSYDSVSIYDDSMKGELLGKFCGNHTDDPLVPIRSGHGRLVVYFETDNTLESYGFAFIYKFLNPRASMICISYNLMSTLPATYKEKWQLDMKKEERSKYVPIARMMSCKQYPKCNVTRPQHMKFTFEHFRYDRNVKKCIHWPVDVHSAYHHPRPCWVVKTNMTHTICECHTWGIVTVVGRRTADSNIGTFARYQLGKNCLVSVILVAICLGFTLIYLFLKDQWGAAVYEVFTRKEYDSGRLIQMHILLQILLMEIIFTLVTFDIEASMVVCFFFAGLFYYLIQTVFFWLFVYTLFLHSRLREIFDSSKYNSYKIYLFIGYGIPFIVTLTVSGLNFQSADRGVCWLLFRGTTVWGFSGVIIALGVLTLLLLIHVAIKARNMDHGHILIQKCLKAMFTSFFVLFTAVFGTLAFQERNYFYEWCFSICNMLQGFSISIMYCILRREDAIIRANQIGVLVMGEEDEYDELKKFDDDDGDVTFADMPPVSDDEDDKPTPVIKPAFPVKRVVRVNEEKRGGEFDEATVDEP